MARKFFTTVLKIFLMALIIQFISITTSNADNSNYWDKIFKSADNFVQIGKEGDSLDNQNLKDASDEIYSLLSTLGIVLSVIVGAILGIKLMLASAEDKAKVKEALIPYIIGCIVIFGAFTIWKVCIEIFSGV